MKNKRYLKYLGSRYKNVGLFLRFFVVTVLYLLTKLLLSVLGKNRIAKNINNKVKDFTESLDTDRTGVIGRGDIAEMALASLIYKKSRTLITVGGVTVGITTVVLLVSIGYGLQEMVVSRVARLEEMRQIDVYTQNGSSLKISDESLNEISGIPNVESVLPVISVVGRVSYQKSVSDLAVYGVTSEFLKQSATQIVSGKIFSSDDMSVKTNVPSNEDKAIKLTNEEIVMGGKIRDVSIKITGNEYLKLRASADRDSELLGYVSGSESTIQAQEVWGATYLDEKKNGEAGTDKEGNLLGKWVKITAPVYKKTDTGYEPAIDIENAQIQKEGYVAEIDLEIIEKNPASKVVLGETTEKIVNPVAQPAIISVGNGWVEIASESAAKESLKIDKVNISPIAKKEAVVNRGMLSVLGIDENEAVGKTFDVSFVVTGNLLNDNQRRLESNSTSYTIVGVTPDAKSAQFFVPFIDLRTLGIGNFSQAKVVVKSQDELSSVRKQIEAMGLKTRSVVDTVNQINQLFGTLRAFLAILGLVALFVAAVGMFNTLTVSLMERTREVGLMKAMGMRSSEVRELFLAESLIMSGAGGVLGVICGVLIGKMIEVILSSFAIFRGAGYVNITFTPPVFALAIILLSLFVGFATGFYPSRRATKISALNALRYE